MEKALILETTFLIDFERERQRGLGGPVADLLRSYANHRLFITPTIAGELAAGTSLADRSRWQEFIAPFRILATTPDVAWEYGKAFRHLQRNGALIGANDLWIAATGLAYGVPVVTRNAEHYRRVPGLDVIGYSRDVHGSAVN
jgi:tRNA(fMet)-specific endonuclease VapC